MTTRERHLLLASSLHMNTPTQPTMNMDIDLIYKKKKNFYNLCGFEV